MNDKPSAFPEPVANPDMPVCRFICAILVAYTDGEHSYQNYINLVMKSSTGIITKAELQSAHVGAVRTICAETGFTPDCIKDITIISISSLGWSSDEQFNANYEHSATEVV